MITIALHQLKSPQNVGVIVRSLVAFGGRVVTFVGHQLAWEFKKGSQAFSRKLEQQCEIKHIITDDEFFDWCLAEGLEPIALEISQSAISILNFHFPERVVLVVGNEANGLPDNFVARCKATVFIPQFGPVGSINAGVAASIAMYEYAKQWGHAASIGDGGKFEGEQSSYYDK